MNSNELDELFSVFSDDLEILVEVFNQFKLEYQTYISSIKTEIENQNSKDLELHAHTLKGVMRNFYFNPAIAPFEKLAREGSFDGCNELLEDGEQQLIHFIELCEIEINKKNVA